MCAVDAMFCKKHHPDDSPELKFISESVVYKNITVSTLRGRGENQFETCVSGSVMNVQGKSIPFIVATNWRVISVSVNPDYQYLPIIEKMLFGNYEICTMDTVSFTKGVRVFFTYLSLCTELTWSLR